MARTHVARATPVVRAALDPHTPPPAEVFPAPVAVRRGRSASTVAWACLIGFAALFGLVRARRSEALDLAVTLQLQANRHPMIERLMRDRFVARFPAAEPAHSAARDTRAAGCPVAGRGGVPRRSVGDLAPVDGRQGGDPPAAPGRRGEAAGRGRAARRVELPFRARVVVRRAVRVRRLPGRGARATGSVSPGDRWDALLGLVALVGPSRIQQGHHWFTDVTASYLLGTSYVVGARGAVSPGQGASRRGPSHDGHRAPRGAAEAPLPRHPQSARGHEEGHRPERNIA